MNMPPPEVHTADPTPESDDVTTPETEETPSATRPEIPGDGDGLPSSDRTRERRMQRQRRMKQAWRKLVDSFDEVFYNSDESDGPGSEQYYRRRSTNPRYSDDGSRHPPARRGTDDRYRSPRRGLPPTGDHYDGDVVNRSRSASGPRTISLDGTAPVDPIPDSMNPPQPISFVTELYDYSEASRRGEYEEAYLKTSFEKDAPAKVVQAKIAGQTAAEGLVFKLVTMYAIPHARKRGHGRNHYDRDSVDDQGDDYLRHAENSLGVLAGLGTYMIITSQAVLKALRTIISMHPDLPRLAESVTLPEPFCFIVQYKKEIEEYLATLPALPESEPVPAQQSLPAPTQTTGVEDTAAGVEDTKSAEATSAPPSAPPKLAELTEEQQERHDLQVLMGYTFSDEFSQKYEAEIALHAQKKCTFELAWMLFRPGSYVYSWEGDSVNCFIVDSVELEGLFAKRTRSSQAEVRPRNRLRGQEFNFSRTPESIVVKMCYLEFDGEYIGRRPKKVAITAFEGDKNINALPVFPEEYCTIDNIREKLITRGKKYVELTKRTYAEYNGETLSVPQRSVKSRIMIDSRTFYNDRDSGMTKAPKLKVPKEEGAISSESSLSDASDDSATPYRARRSMRSHKRKIRDLRRRPNRNTTLTEHDILKPDETDFRPEQYMLLTQRVYGFILKERIWDLLDVSSVKEPNFQEDMINDLVLKDEAKTLVQALSNSHAEAARTDPYMQQRGFGDVGGAPTTWSADFVQNKGEGRIFLLHGKPGVGKTTTAECVAEQSRSPLLSITCGDLGIYPDEVEKNLMKWLKLATLWRAVLLLDEADVYLESRVSGDLQRNSLVSIFLRALEYYQGLLFLTTNRIGTFDEALISRIHVVLHYPDFTDAERQTIWQTSFRKLDDERPDIKLGPGVMDYALDHEELKKLKWNGREIRNAFNTIVALAEFDAEKKRRLKPGDEKSVVVKLERSHLKQVVEMSGNFKEYMRRTKGMDESKYQHVARVRDGDLIQDPRDPRRGHRGDIPMR
jgi:hypothetical protein